MAAQTNPIRRLSDFVNRIIKYGDDNYPPIKGTPGGENPASMIWTEALGISEDDLDYDLQFLNSLMAFLKLVDTCEGTVRRSNSIDPESRELYMEQFQDLKTFMFQIDVATWSEFRKQFNDYFLRALRWAASDMSRHFHEEVIPDATLQSLQSEIEDLIEQVIASTLNTELKTALLQGLEFVRQAIISYRLTGAEGIRDAVDRNVGILARCRDELAKESDNESRSVLADVVKIIAKADKIGGTALKYAPLALNAGKAIARMLSSGE